MFLGPQIEGFVLLALIEFPEVLFLSLIFCFDYMSIGVSGVLKSSTIVLLSVSPFKSVSVCLMY